MQQPIYHLSKDLAFEVFSQFTKDTQQAVLIIDLQIPRILYINPEGKELVNMGQHNETEALDHLIQMIHVEDREHVLGEINNYLGGNGSNSIEFRIVTPEPDQWICLTLYSIDDAAGQKIQLLVFAENITARKEYELYLLKHNSKKNSILGILSHDLRGPLSNISLISGMLKEEHHKESFEKTDNLIDMIERTCNQALDLINQYLTKEHLESSNIEIKKIRVEIVGRVLSIIDTYKAAHNQLNRNFKLEAFPRDRIWVEVDDVKLLQIVNNLVSNAIKFTHAGGNIHIKLEETKNSLLITLQDDGIGIPEELQPFLFDEFTKAGRKGLDGEKTVGLGMSITKKMVEIQGGKIWFTSREGKGTTFYIEIPKS